jgi:hypothetical protein
MAIFNSLSWGTGGSESFQKKSLTSTPQIIENRIITPSLCIIVTNVLFIIGVKGRD